MEVGVMKALGGGVLSLVLLAGAFAMMQATEAEARSGRWISLGVYGGPTAVRGWRYGYAQPYYIGRRGVSYRRARYRRRYDYRRRYRYSRPYYVGRYRTDRRNRRAVYHKRFRNRPYHLGVRYNRRRYRTIYFQSSRGERRTYRWRR